VRHDGADRDRDRDRPHTTPTISATVMTSARPVIAISAAALIMALGPQPAVWGLASYEV
jgi:hypothetical protein